MVAGVGETVGFSNLWLLSSSARFRLRALLFREKQLLEPAQKLVGARVSLQASLLYHAIRSLRQMAAMATTAVAGRLFSISGTEAG